MASSGLLTLWASVAASLPAAASFSARISGRAPGVRTLFLISLPAQPEADLPGGQFSLSAD